MSSGSPGKLMVARVTTELHLPCTEWISYTLWDGIGTLSPSLMQWAFCFNW